jgi:hypothetical protein
MENIFFGLGRHYVDDLLASRLTADSSGDNLRIAKEVTRNIPRPTNDLLGRYIETNISLLTENRPRPRVTAKSDSRDDKMAAELSELTMEYLWEKLDLPEKHRNLARLCLYTGTAWLEVIYDPLQPRYVTIPQMEEVPETISPEGKPIRLPTTRRVPKVEGGRAQYATGTQYGDITASIISGFEMHLPTVHYWNGPEMAWIMRETYIPVELLKDKYGGSRNTKKTTKQNGWFLDSLDKTVGENIHNLPLWWWERMSDMVEGPGPSLYVGTHEQWEDYAIVKVLDRRPSQKWPNGRTVIVAGDQLLYDSPKEVGARAYHPRWPTRWHPYIRYQWEPQPGSIYSRSLVSKLLPKLKRVNSIDTTLIMWRRTVPIATWLVPKGSSPVEDIFSGRPGQFWEYDPRRTQSAKPEPVYPPDYPKTALEERQQQLAEMESIAGTEEILRGQRPTGVTSAAMLDVLRKQAMASRSPILQSWDESIQTTGTSLLQETIKHIGPEDSNYRDRIRILARERASQYSIEKYSGTDISDNVVVRVDTAASAMVSKEARQARAIEFLQYLPNLMQAPVTLQQAILEELGFKDTLDPSGPDVQRAKLLISLIKQERFDLVIPFPEDDPFVIHEILVNEMKAESFLDMPPAQQMHLVKLIQLYEREILMIQKKQQEMQMRMAAQAQQMQIEGQAEAGGA